MGVSVRQQATECGVRSTDWTTIGTQIVRVATIASAIHLMERVDVASETAGSQGQDADAVMMCSVGYNMPPENYRG